MKLFSFILSLYLMACSTKPLTDTKPISLANKRSTNTIAEKIKSNIVKSPAERASDKIAEGTFDKETDKRIPADLPGASQKKSSQTIASIVQLNYGYLTKARLLRGLSVAIETQDSKSQILTFDDLKNQNSLLEIGSLSKSFTGVLIALLAIENKIDLEAPISKYVPELEGCFVGSVTAHQLATHSAGLARAFTDASGKVSQNYTEKELLEFLITFVPNVVNFSSMPTRNYSNLGFAALALVISRIENATYGESLKKRILDPLLMQSTGLIATKTLPKGLVKGYDFGLRPLKYTALSDLASASGGIYSSIKDMQAWLKFNMNDEPTNLGKAAQVSHRLGLGWDSLPAQWPLWKNGAMPDGFGSYMFFDSTPGLRRGAVILVNTLNVPIVDGLAQAVTGSSGSLMETLDWSPIAASKIQKLTGLYLNSPAGLEINVVKIGTGFLGIDRVTERQISMARLLKTKTTDVYLVNDDATSVTDVVKFIRDSQGDVTSIMYLSPNGVDGTGKPIYKQTVFERKRVY